MYCFPPFSILWRTLEKIRREEVEDIVVIPCGLHRVGSLIPTITMIIDHPLVFQAAHLHLPNKPWAQHPLKQNLNLPLLRLSGKQFNVRPLSTRWGNHPSIMVETIPNYTWTRPSPPLRALPPPHPLLLTDEQAHRQPRSYTLLGGE